MCGRFGFVKILNEQGNYRWIRIINDVDLAFQDNKRSTLFSDTRYDVRPTQYFPGIYQNSRGLADAENMRFGLFPSWSKKPIINARVENLVSSKLWKSHIIKNRCIVVASYFYEWQDTGNKKTVPWIIRKKESEYVYFAALYAEEFDKKRNLAIKSFAIITQNANSLMMKIHNHGVNKFRQPVLLDDNQLDRWLDFRLQNLDDIMPCIRNYEADEINARPLAAIGDDLRHTAPVELNQ